MIDSTPCLGIIGGTGLTRLPDLTVTRREVMHTPWGEPSAPLVHGEMCGRHVVFLARHGAHHTIPPHQVNYRANVWAMKNAGVTAVVAVAAVGAIHREMLPGSIAVPDQIIDYTWSRANTYFEGDHLDEVVHVDMTEPYDARMRDELIAAAGRVEAPCVDFGTYCATQGPRLETAAEINRLERDGGHMVGMTGMPEAVLAREQGLRYACLAVMANWGAGRSDGPITMEEIEHHLLTGMGHARRVIADLIGHWPLEQD
ncbi:MAG: S-methyl-5'-thioinosine phosphorylase [Thioalkalivibrionaceae bacterium]